MYILDTNFLSQIISKYYRGRYIVGSSWSPYSPYVINQRGHFLWDTKCTEKCVQLRTKNAQLTNYGY
jgi:hypothetical protein